MMSEWKIFLPKKGWEEENPEFEQNDEGKNLLT